MSLNARPAPFDPPEPFIRFSIVGRGVEECSIKFRFAGFTEGRSK